MIRLSLSRKAKIAVDRLEGAHKGRRGKPHSLVTARSMDKAKQHAYRCLAAIGWHKMTKNNHVQPVMIIEIERDLKKNIRSINKLLNDNPELARLVLINPILVLEDLGVQISAPVKQHIINRLRFPAKLVARREELGKEVEDEFTRLNIHHKLPLTSSQRATLVFDTLKVPAIPEHLNNLNKLDTDQLRAYSEQHPLLMKLAEYERFRKGGLIFFPRHVYEQYKSGVKQLHWVNAVRFKT